MTFGALSALFWLASGITAAPALLFSCEVALAALPGRTRRKPPSARPIPIAVLIPAHNESSGIGPTVSHIKGQLRATDRLIVVADNCTDDTAARAREAGAEVLVRTDAEKRGKGYALSFGAQALSHEPPEIVLIVDADCRVQRGSLERLANLAYVENRPTQAIYLMNRPAGSSPISGISAFAFLVRNKVRPLGLKRLGLPCLLTGTGMAFPWSIYRDAPPTHDFLVEDLLLGHELALKGTPPLLDEETVVVSELPSGEAASFKQRRRWEHGQLSVLRTITPRLLSAGLRRGNLGLIALALDGLVPPLALLVFLQLGMTSILWLGVPLGMPSGPAWLASGALSLMGLCVLWAWGRHGRGLLPPRDLLFIPKYILWKVPLYRTFARSGAHSEWERTERP